MSVESNWYCSFVNNKPPTLRRLCRLPIETQWEAAIEIAIAYSSGMAGFRNVGKSYIGEITWYVLGWSPKARSANASKSIWWLIPGRIDRRVFAIYEAAQKTVLRTSPSVSSDEVTACLKRWKKSGAWRKIAAGIFPKTGEIGDLRSDLG